MRLDLKDRVWRCPKCSMKEMRQERGSWTGRELLRCGNCGLVDYPDEVGTRKYGKPKIVKRRAGIGGDE